ncbi:MAG: rhomboid family intramembrane serine protease [Thermoanaerobaculia bacterium]|nr:rhomboid family intramembrane serine protease [Thermoanaerobaculia bacterium]
MIPLKDSRRSPGVAWGTWALVVANLAVFVWELRLGSGLETAISRLALSPAEALSTGSLAELLARLPRLVAALFLHGGWLHLLGNLAFLAVFGDDVESRLKLRRYLLLYLGSGLIASAAQIAASPRSTLPLIGASGAIAGVLGAFLVLFPKARLAGILPLGCLVIPMKSRAFLFIPFWFLLQLYGALAAPPGSLVGGVAWYAHLAGFAAGPILLFLLRRR